MDVKGSKKKYDRAMRILFVSNAAFLVWAILWKCGVPAVGTVPQRTINLIPFRGNTNWEMQFNVLLFLPFGLFLAAVMPTKKTILSICSVVLTSLSFEVIQYALAVGHSDVTDTLLNAFGGIIGIVAYLLLSKLFRKHARKALMTACMLIVAFEVYLSVSFLLIGYVRLGHVMFRM